MRMAPIALFAYKRLDHLKRTVDALKANHLALESDLYIFSDGPKNKEDEVEVEKVRTYIKSISDGFSSVYVKFSEKNNGLAASIVEGVTNLVNKEGSVIVVEDDVVTSPFFLSYMNDSLVRYKNEKLIMHVSGYSFPMKDKLPDVFLSQMPFVWGWGTWKRAWDNYSDNAEVLLVEVERKGRDKFNYDGIFNFTSPLRQNAKGQMKTWAIKWQASIFINGGLCLTPFPSFTNNIGHDGTGEHYDNSNEYYNNSLSLVTPGNISSVIESIDGREAIKKFLKQIKPSIPRLIICKVKTLLQNKS